MGVQLAGLDLIKVGPAPTPGQLRSLSARIKGLGEGAQDALEALGLIGYEGGDTDRRAKRVTTSWRAPVWDV